jgi:integrase
MAIRTHASKTGRKTYGVLVHRSGGKEWIGTFPTMREARQAEAKALADPKRSTESVTVAEWVEKFLARYEREHKDSSYDTARAALRHFVADFGERPIGSITRLEAIEWADRVPPSRVPVVVTCMNAAVDRELIERNPFRGLSHRVKSRGRADEHPPTHEELGQLLDACHVHGDYAPQMRNLIAFAAYSGMRPGELFALEWTDVDMPAMRIDVRRRLYRGSTDLPKSNKVRRIALTPPARDAMLGQPTNGTLVFRAKRGGQLTQPTLSGYWGKVLAAAGLDFDFYLATKHWCVHHMYVTLGLPPPSDSRADGLVTQDHTEDARGVRTRRRGSARGDRPGLRCECDTAAGGQLSASSSKPPEHCAASTLYPFDRVVNKSLSVAGADMTLSAVPDPKEAAMAATSPTASKPAKRNTRARAGSKAKAKDPGSASKAKPASKRPKYSDDVKAITEKARGYACPETKQGPVARQVQQVQQVLGDPREALKEAGVTQKALKGYATGSDDKEVRTALRPLGQRVVAAGGAKQWVTGRSLAATLTAWLEQK